MNNMSDKVITLALTGGIGSGKSTVAEIFSDLGAYIIDADRISHQVLEKGRDAYYETIKIFGDEILLCDKSIDRKKLAQIVFSDKFMLDMLNKITHKHIFQTMQEKIDLYKSENKSGIIVLDVPLLFSSDFPIYYDKSIAVVADREIRIMRAALRDNCSKEKIMQRMKNQISDDKLITLSDYVIENSGSYSELKTKSKQLYKQIKENGK